MTRYQMTRQEKCEAIVEKIAELVGAGRCWAVGSI